MDISTTDDCDEDRWTGPERPGTRLSWQSAASLISSASAALWAVVALVAVILIT